jgi:hypothetical protein
MAWKLKLDDGGNPAVRDALPVFLMEDGKEATFDPNAMHTKILELNRESKVRREKLKDAEGKLALLGDVDDLESWVTEARQALEEKKKLGEKKAVEDEPAAEGSEEAKAREEARAREELKAREELERRLKAQLAERELELKGELEKRERVIRNVMLSNKFATCALFGGSDPKTTMTPDAAESLFGRHFRVELDGEHMRLCAVDEKGEAIPSPTRVAEPADFSEAIAVLWERYPYKDKYARSTGSGSGGTGGTGAAGTKLTEVQLLRKQLEEAQKVGRGDLVITLTTRLWEAEQRAAKVQP